MSDQEADGLRCLAHEAIVSLWRAGRVIEIELLKAHCERAIEEPNS